MQTGLSLPPELPEEVEAVLSRYFIQPESSNDDSLSTSSMRRKLFFQCEDEPPSPVKPAPTVDLSPVTSGLASSPSFQVSLNLYELSYTQVLLHAFSPFFCPSFSTCVLCGFEENSYSRLF